MEKESARHDCILCRHSGSNGARFIMEVYDPTRSTQFGKARHQQIYKPCKRFSDSGFVIYSLNDEFCKNRETEEEYIERKGW